MASLVLGVAGAAIGSTFGMPQLGFMIGSSLGGYLFPGDPLKQEGQRLNDPRVQTNTNGLPINKFWGTYKTTGNIIWATDFVETKTVTEQGGKGGGPTVETTTYSYSISLAVGIADCEISAVRRIWANKKLVYDTSDSSKGDVGMLEDYITIHYGSEEQMPDTTMQQYLGAYTPAHRGLAYAVFTNIPLEQFNNQIPNFEFEVVRADAVELLPYDYAFYGLGLINGQSGTFDKLYEHPITNKIYGVNQVEGKLIIAKIDPKSISLLATKEIPGIVGFDDIYNNKKSLSFNSDGNIVITQGSSDNDNIKFYIINKDTLSYQIIDTSTYSGGTDPFLPIKNSNYNENADLFVKQNNKILAMSIGTDKTSFSVSELDIGINLSTSNQNFNLQNTVFHYGINAYDKTNDRLYFITYLKNEDGTPNFWNLYLNYVQNGTLYEQVATITTANNTWRATSLHYDALNQKVIATLSKNTTFAYTDLLRVVKINVSNFSNEGFNDWTFGDPEYYTAHECPVYKDGVLYGNFARRLDYALSIMSGYNVFTGETQYKSVYKQHYNGATVYFGSNPNSIVYSNAYGSTYYSVFGTYGYAVMLYNGNKINISTYPLDLLVKEICIDAGLTEQQIDATELQGIEVIGFQRNGQVKARDLLETLSMIYDFSGAEIGGKIKFIKNGKDFIAEITEDEIGAKFYSQTANSDTNYFKSQRGNNSELLRSLNVVYFDILKDFDQATQQSLRINGVNSKTVQVPVVMTQNQAKQVADRIMFKSCVSMDTYQFETNIDYSFIYPGDVIKLTRKGVPYIIRITKKEEDQGILKFEGVQELKSVYTQTSTGDSGKIPDQKIEIIPETALYLLDIPIFDITYNDGGNFVVVDKLGDGNWRGATVYKSDTINGTYSGQTSIYERTITGQVVNFYNSNHKLNTIDYFSYIDVNVSGELFSITREQLLNGANLCLVGKELIQFMNAEQIGQDTFRLSSLLRGRFGTEKEISNLAIDNDFIFFNFENNSIKRINRNDYRYGVNLYYKGATFLTMLDDAQSQQFTNNGVGLKPYSVINVKHNRNDDGNLYVEFSKRIRGQAILNNTLDVSDPDGDFYEIDIYKDGKVKRTIETTNLNFTYTASQQISDFGSVQSLITLKIYKINKNFGRGFDYSATI